jgi:hypothetical protein
MACIEARGASRHLFSASCIARSARDGRLLSDHTLDASYSGVGLAACGQAVVGERVELSIELPGSRVWVRGSGRIERVIAGRRAGDAGPAFGVRVDRMDGLSRILLSTVARSFPRVRGDRGAARDYAERIAQIARDA